MSARAAPTRGTSAISISLTNTSSSPPSIEVSIPPANDNDIRSPGSITRTPKPTVKKAPAAPTPIAAIPIPDFITQTDSTGKASTPRPAEKSAETEHSQADDTATAPTSWLATLFPCCCSPGSPSTSTTQGPPSPTSPSKRALFSPSRPTSTRTLGGASPTPDPATPLLSGQASLPKTTVPRKEASVVGSRD